MMCCVVYLGVNDWVSLTDARRDVCRLRVRFFVIGQPTGTHKRMSVGIVGEVTKGKIKMLSGFATWRRSRHEVRYAFIHLRRSCVYNSYTLSPHISGVWA